MKVYYDNEIRDWVKTPEQHSLLREIRGMNINQLRRFSDELRTEVALDHSVESTHTFKTAGKLTIVRLTKFKNDGATFTGWNGSIDGQPPTVWTIIWKTVTMMIVLEILGDLLKSFLNDFKKD